MSPHLQLVIFGAKRCILLPDHLLQLSDQLLRVGEPFSHFLHCCLSRGGSQRRAWTLRRVALVRLKHSSTHLRPEDSPAHPGELQLIRDQPSYFMSSPYILGVLWVSAWLSQPHHPSTNLFTGPPLDESKPSQPGLCGCQSTHHTQFCILNLLWT